MAAVRSLAQQQDAIAALHLTHAEELVMLALLRYGDWETGANCYPTLETLAKRANVNRRTAQRILDRFTCRRPVRLTTGAVVPCCACGNRDLLVLQREATPNSSASYAIVIDAAIQGRLPDLIAAPAAERMEVPRDEGDAINQA